MLSNRYRVCLVLLTTFVFIQFLYRFYVRRAPVSFSGDSQNSLPSLQRVAIVGAGAAGCSFAKYLKEVFPSIQLDVFEKDTRVGGRVHSTVFDYPTFGIHEVVEWGASIFVDRNKNVLKAFEQFNLRNKEDPDEPYMTLYNGTHVVCTLPTDDSWTSTWIWFRRYNYNPYKLRRLADSVAVLLDPIYTSENDAYESYETLVNALGLKPYTAITSEEFLKPKFSEVFLKEIVEPVTLVNYANPLSAVHSLASLIGFVSGNWYSVKEGNQKLFESLLQASNASVYFDTEVLDIQSTPGTPLEHTLITSKGNFASYQVVVIAIPLDVFPLPMYRPPQPYQRLYVYHVLGRLNTTTFPQDPGLIFTTFPSAWNVTSIARLARYPEHGVDLFKVFSKENLTSLHTYFEACVHVESQIKHAYPILTPQPTYPKLHRGNHVYYLNGMERFLSTMETETIASMNLVRLLKKKFSVA